MKSAPDILAELVLEQVHKLIGDGWNHTRDDRPLTRVRIAHIPYPSGNNATAVSVHYGGAVVSIFDGAIHILYYDRQGKRKYRSSDDGTWSSPLTTNDTACYLHHYDIKDPDYDPHKHAEFLARKLKEAGDRHLVELYRNVPE